MPHLLTKAELHERFTTAVGPAALVGAEVDRSGELVMSLRSPLPQRARVYIFNATNPPGGRPTAEHKIQLIMNGQQKGEHADFDWSGVDLVLVCGYAADYDVFVFWDAALHVKFAYSKNCQVRTAKVQTASAAGVLERQTRWLQTGQEIVICAPRQLVPVAIAERAYVLAGGPQRLSTGGSSGQPYIRPSRDERAVAKSRVFAFDPDLLDRGTRAHMDVQDLLADAVASRGWQPLSPAEGDPLFDVGWVAGETAWIAEVKSLTDDNEERQLRLGLGQALSYAHLVDWQASTNRPVLAVERQPSASYWSDLCAHHGVALSWPEAFDDLLDMCL